MTVTVVACDALRGKYDIYCKLGDIVIYPRSDRVASTPWWTHPKDSYLSIGARRLESRHYVYVPKVSNKNTAPDSHHG